MNPPEVWRRCDACGITSWGEPDSACCCGGVMRVPPKMNHKRHIAWLEGEVNRLTQALLAVSVEAPVEKEKE